MAKIHYIGSIANTTKYKDIASFNDFIKWFNEQKVIAHDTETNKCESILDREIRCLQYGDIKGEDLWVIQWSYLESNQQQQIIKLMHMSNKLFIVMTTFEYVLWRKYNAVLNKVWDIFSCEKALDGGQTREKGFFSYAGMCKRRFDIDVSKAEQGNFDDDIMTDEKVEYAATDVLKPGKIYELQKAEAYEIDKQLGFTKIESKVSRTRDVYRRGMTRVLWWESEFSKVLGDMEFNGIQFDSEKWIDNYNQAFPKVQQAEKELNEEVKKKNINNLLTNEGYYYPEDKIDIIWTSSQKKQQVLSWIFSDIKETNKVALKTYLKDNDPNFPKDLKLSGKAWENHSYPREMNDKFAVIKTLLFRSKEDIKNIDKALNDFFIDNFRDKLIEAELLIPKGTLKINWASPVQRLFILQQFHPELEKTDAKSIEDVSGIHEIFRIFKKYTEANSLITKYGLKWLESIDSDGKVRTKFDPVLATGRVSAFKPSVLTIPGDQNYRDAFIASPGWKTVGADYNGEELFIISVFAKEPIWLKSFKDGSDLHSVNASLLDKQEWEEGTEDDCNFRLHKQKCKCPKHKDLRDGSKTKSFGLNYGLTPYGLASRTGVSQSEAQKQIREFFRIIPNIERRLKGFSNFAVKNGWISEPALGRTRFFDKWKVDIMNKYLSFPESLNYYEKQEAKKQMEAIKKEAMNHPIQSTGAAIMKIGGVLLRRAIMNNKLQDKVRLLLPPHDRNLSCINLVNCGKILEFLGTSKYFYHICTRIVMYFVSNNLKKVG